MLQQVKNLKFKPPALSVRQFAEALILLLCRAKESVSFFTVMERARRHGKIAIGFKLLAEKQPEINPKDKASPHLSLGTVESVVILCDDLF